MQLTDAFILVMALVGSLSMAFVFFALITDFIWPWAESMRKPRPQATRRK